MSTTSDQVWARLGHTEKRMERTVPPEERPLAALLFGRFTVEVEVRVARVPIEALRDHGAGAPWRSVGGRRRLGCGGRLGARSGLERVRARGGGRRQLHGRRR